MRRLLALSLLAVTQPLCAQGVDVAPLFGTELRYEQYAADRLASSSDAILFRARPGVSLSTGAWSIEAVSDAAVKVRRTETSATAGRVPIRPEAIQLGELRLEYRGLPSTQISVGRQHLGMAGAALTGDRDGDQTFDAARIRWAGVPGLSADVAYAWSSSSQWAAAEGPLPLTVPGDNLFAQLNWTSALGTFSGYAYQVDQRNITDSQFRLLNQIYGARFAGSRKLGEDIRLNYAMGYVRQTGSVAHAAGGAPTYWQIGSRLDLGELGATQTSYRRFAANGISTQNGNTISLATSETRGRMTVGATFNDFRPVEETGAISTRDVRISLGLIF
ncbi:MAG: hypothetical protein ABW128_12695 [Rhizorhabdus sp.]